MWIVFADPSSKYKVGDEGPGGGIVFYASPEGFEMIDEHGEKRTYHYLEVSKTDLTTDEEFITWCPCSYESSYHKKSGQHIYDELEGGQKEFSWSGLVRFSEKWLTHDLCKNISHPGGAPNRKNCAAQLCALYTTDTTKKGDWYLPSTGELMLLYISSKYMMDSRILYNDMRDYKYWGIIYTEYTSPRPVVIDFKTGDEIKSEKLKDQFSVRAIRAF